MKACMGKLPAKSEIGAEVVKSVGDEGELGAGNFEGIDGLIRGRGTKAMLDKPSVGFLDVESVAVMANNNIGFIKQSMEIAD